MFSKTSQVLAAIDAHYDLILLGVFGLCLLGQAAAVHWGHWLSKLVGIGGWCLASSQRFWGALQDKDSKKSSAEYRELLASWHFSLVTLGIAGYQTVVVLTSFSIVVNIIEQRQRSWTMLQDGCLVVSWVGTLMLKAHVDSGGTKSTTRTSRVIAFYYGISMVASVMFILGSAPMDLHLHDLQVMFCRVAAAACVPWKSWVVVGSVVYSSVFFCHPWLRGDGQHDQHVGFLYLAARQAAAGAMAVVVCSMSQRFLAMLAGAMHELNVSREAAERLLGLLCNAVVRLKSDLQVMEHSPKLADMLFINDGQDLWHTSLGASLDDNCTNNLSVALTSMAGHADPSCGAINLRLQRSTAGVLPVQAFFINHTASNNDEFLVGFREVGLEASKAVGDLSEALAIPDDYRAAVAAQEELEPWATIPERHTCWPLPWARPPTVLGQSQASSYTTGPGTTLTLAARHRLRTIHKVIHEQLIDLARSTNHAYAADDACCLYHSSIESLFDNIVKLRMPACHSDFSLHDAWQCDECGVLAKVVPADNGSCFACGFSNPSGLGRMSLHLRRTG
eukprot:TRINITY_DN34037_c0_g1_i4.p1 TRINITY_DN34037_c0_g1~~TRINITY_DN34037_c0_g1_i4.p1  ORF type:complete len:562 (+),score=45.89 TRINITY_DN34037_c0_g1_i4:79-1764(+)